MHSKCSASAFLVFPIHANASKYNANESVVYANALLLHDIKERIYNLYIFISLHSFIYRERGNKFPSPPNRDKFQGIWHFFPELFARFVDLSYFCGALHTKRRLITANNNRWRYFYAASGKHIGIVPPWKSVMEILPLRCSSTGKAMPFSIV